MLGNTLPKVAANTYYYSKNVIKQIKLSCFDISELPPDGSKEEMECKYKGEMKYKNNRSYSPWDELDNLFDKQSENMPEHTEFELLLRPEYVLLPPFKFMLPPSTGLEHLPRCKNGKKTTQLLGSDLRIEDCRPLKTRSPALYKALEKGGEAYGEIIMRLNKFGMRSTIDLNPYMSNATEHLSAYFDKYLITDGSGRAIFNSDDVDFDHSNEIQNPHRKAIAFTNHEDIYRLLRMEEARLTDAQQHSAPIGSSALKSLRVGDVDLSIFIHPFMIQEMPGGSEAISRKDEKEENERDKSGDQSEDSSPNGKELATSGSVFHIIGIVTSADLQQEAVRLELGTVVDATLLVCVGIALLPIVWFWTAGDRLIIARWVPCILGISGVLALLFNTVMFLGRVTRITDEGILDQALVDIAQHMVVEFNKELKDGRRKLLGWHLTTIAEEDKWRNIRDYERQNGSVLGSNFFCPADSRSNIEEKWSNDIPRFDIMFSLNSEGRQINCQFNQRKSKTPNLPLKFRAYFNKPYEGKSWAMNPSSKFEYTGIDNIESDISCPYFIDRIDSIIRGDKATVLSMPVLDVTRCGKSQFCCVPRGLVAEESSRPVVIAGGIRFESLELGVVPPTFEYAVVEDDTGKILFHSDERREFVANFIRSVGNSHHVLASFERPTKAKDLLCENRSSTEDGTKEGSCRTMAGDSLCENAASAEDRAKKESCQRKVEDLLYDNKANIIDLHYDGVPIRAFVSELRPEIPWRLVVYRGHEINSRIAALSSSMAIFTLSIYFIFILFIVFLAWLFLWLDVQKGEKSRIMECLGLKAGDFVQRPGLLRAMLERLLDVHVQGVLLWVFIKFLLALLAIFGDIFVTLSVCLLSDIVMLIWALRKSSSREKHGDSNTVSSFTVPLLLVSLVVLPAIAGFLHFRSSLTLGVSRYIGDQTRERNIDLDNECRRDYIDYDWLRAERHPTSSCSGAGGSSCYSVSSCLSNKGLSSKLAISMRRGFDSSPGQGYLLQMAEPFVAHAVLSKMIIQYSSSGYSEEESCKCLILEND